MPFALLRGWIVGCWGCSWGEGFAGADGGKVWVT